MQFCAHSLAFTSGFRRARLAPPDLHSGRDASELPSCGNKGMCHGYRPDGLMNPPGDVGAPSVLLSGVGR